MLQSAIETVRSLPGGRWNVVASALAGFGFFVGEMLIRDLSVFRAFMEGMGAALVVLVVVGTAQRYWGGGQLDSAQGPGGWGMRFLPPTRRTLGDLNERMNQQMTTVNQRLYDLGHAAFKEPARGNDKEE